MVSGASRRWAHIRTLLTTVLIEVVFGASNACRDHATRRGVQLHPSRRGGNRIGRASPSIRVMPTYGSLSPRRQSCRRDHPSSRRRQISAIVGYGPDCGHTLILSPAFIAASPCDSEESPDVDRRRRRDPKRFGRSALAPLGKGNLRAIGGQTQEGVRRRHRRRRWRVHATRLSRDDLDE